jgi:glutamine synthetase
MAGVDEILEGWQRDGIGFVRFELPDMHGISRSKTVPIGHAADYADRGLNMYGGASVLDSVPTSSPGRCTTRSAATATSCCSRTRGRPP